MLRRRLFLLYVLVFTCSTIVLGQDRPRTGDKDRAAAKAVLWEQVDIPARDLYLGPGGIEMVPDLKGAVLIGRQPGGNNLKFRIRDREGNEWVAKIADESQPEIAAVRLLWGIGYKTEIDYLIPRIELGKNGQFKNVRLEARMKKVKRDRWGWADNPFVGTRELDGLKIMMAMFNNWDLKDENNAVLISDKGTHYIISDLGSSFGRLARAPQSRSGRSVNDPEGYARSVFIKGASGGRINFAYNGMADHLLKGIKVEHARWLADLLLQLSDKQINDAFRAANYKPEEADMFANAFKARIRALDEATVSTPVAELK
jgi:hypothetical protein